MAQGTLTLGGKTVDDSCLWPRWVKTPAKGIQPLTALWETVAKFDVRSPNFYYVVTFTCHVVEATPWDKEVWLSELRDYIGEGPLAGVWARGTLQVTFTDLYWATSAQGTTEAVRGDYFSFEMWTTTKPVSGSP